MSFYWTGQTPKQLLQRATLSGCTLVLCTSAMAQRSLNQPKSDPILRGSQILDANLGVRADGSRDWTNYTKRQPDFQVGNLLVTGSLAGGKNFRGSVGYTAPGDFRGALGSDAIFKQLQGSALSQIQLANSPLSNDRYLNALGMGMFEYRRDFTPAQQIYTVGQASQINQDRIRLDRTNAYASSRNLYETAVNRDSLGLVQEADTAMTSGRLRAVESTPLQGIYMTDPIFAQQNLSFYDRVSLASAARAGGTELDNVGLPFQTPLAGIAPESMMQGSIFNGTTIGTRRVGDEVRNRISTNILKQDDGTQRTAYERVVRELLLRYGQNENVRLDVNPEVLEAMRAELDAVRALTMGMDLSTDNPTLPSTRIEIETPDESEETEPTASRESDEARAERQRQEGLAMMRRAAEIIRNGGRIESLSAGELGRVKKLMTEGESALRRSAFFEAESRFDEAIRINPGNPMALYGRANAQLGAGLYLSSALTLRKLYSSYPELAGASLVEGLRPNETRLRLNLRSIRSRIERGHDLPSYGLCLAYVGWLLNERILISEGLSYMNATESDEALAELLRAVWSPSPSSENSP